MASIPTAVASTPGQYLQAALDLEAERVWVPQAPGVSFSPLLLSITQGYYVNLLRVQRAGILSRHRHTAPVHAFTLRGEWYYREHEWRAKAGDYVYEPPGETHTLMVPAHCTEMITLFHVSGGYHYLDEQDLILGVEDVFTKLAAARAHWRAIGASPATLESLVR
jgi:2,4'-dihydroxyacetophenone dioxygenase